MHALIVLANHLLGTNFYLTGRTVDNVGIPYSILQRDNEQIEAHAKTLTISQRYQDF